MLNDDMNRILHVTNFLKQKMFYNNHVKFNFLGRLGRDELSTATGDLLFPREQFPRTGLRATDPCTRREVP